MKIVPLTMPVLLTLLYVFWWNREKNGDSFRIAGLLQRKSKIKYGFLTATLHNRIPLGDDDFPVELPVYPDAKEILLFIVIPMKVEYTEPIP